MLRETIVAGRFYPGDPDTLYKEIESYIKGRAGRANQAIEKQDAIATVAPHAGYIYSGSVAGSVYSAINIPDEIILIGPNHTGAGAATSIMTSGQWETPLGNFSVNTELAEKIIATGAPFTEDIRAHLGEHSLEVQLPFIHYFNPEARIVPITVMFKDYNRCRRLGLALAKVIKEYDKKILIAVSSDMNHYEPDELTQKKDHMAIEKILDLDPEGLLKVTSEKNISMCGAIPTAIALVAAIELGATEAELLDYATSGKTSGDFNAVVGYAGLLIK